MRTVITYPLPMDKWSEFEPEVFRFLNTIKEHDPGESYELWAMCCGGQPSEQLKEMFADLPGRFIDYDGGGCDMGSAQHAARLLAPDDFMVMMTTRCYFHRPRWLKHYVAARLEFGPGLYGIAANRDTWPLHVCCRAFAVDAGDLQAYPVLIDTRQKCYEFEVTKENSFTQWMEERGRTARLVMFDGVYEKPDWFKPANRWRDGDQSNLLVWDKHSDIYAQSTPEFKKVLERNCDV